MEKLQRRSAKALGVTLPKDGRAIYLIVEKILTGTEKLRDDWPVHGTTGYDFTNQLAGVLVDASAEAAITKAFHRFIGHTMHFGHLVYAKKRLVMRLALANEVEVLGNMLDRLSEKNRWFRDFTFEALARAVRETIACFPVYRTYLAPGQPVSDEDRQVIERAIAAAKRRNPAIEESIFNFLRDILLFRFPENLDAEAREEHVAFRLEVSAVHRTDHGQGSRGHRRSTFTTGSPRSTKSAASRSNSAFRVETFHRTEFGAASELAGDLARDFHPRHETKRRCARANAGDFRNCRDLAALACRNGAQPIGAGKKRSTNRKRRTRTRNICFTRLCSAPGRSGPMARRSETLGRNTSSASRIT